MMKKEIEIWQTNLVDFFAGESFSDIKYYLLTNYEWDDDSWLEYGFNPVKLTEEDLEGHYLDNGISFQHALDIAINQDEDFPQLFCTLI